MMSRRIVYFLPLLIFICIALFLSKGLEQDPHKLPSVFIDKPMPVFSYPSLLSDEIVTQSMFMGQVSLLNVWGTWCPTCEAEHAMLLEIANSPDLAVYGLNYRDDKLDAINWIHEHGNPYREIIYDQKGMLAIDLGVYGAPETFVIDKKGIIRYKHIGAISPVVWKDILQPLVTELAHE